MTIIRLYGGLHEIRLVASDSAGMPSDIRGEAWTRLAIRSQAEALHLLAPLHDAAWRVRAALAMDGMDGVERQDDHALFATAAGRIASGQWRAYRIETAARGLAAPSAGAGAASPLSASAPAEADRTASPSRTAVATASVAAGRRPPPAAAPRAQSRPPPARQPAPAVEHWIEIELVGEDDKPIPHEAYRVELPDGRIAEGRLDAAGFARLDQLQQGGQCRISFPALDQGAWEFIETVPARGRPPGTT